MILVFFTLRCVRRLGLYVELLCVNISSIIYRNLLQGIFLPLCPIEASVRTVMLVIR